ncbi:MAG: TOBE domain-containing protein, partial [Opitutaceae bacterium]|nr:TOBE domain-containing protein [Opitutaceae bacterium]
LTVSDRIVVMNKGRIIQQGSPHEVYHQPASRFVASFLGHANFIDAQRTDSGLAETAFGRLQTQSPLTHREATLCIRPEEVIYPVTPACPNHVTGTIREVIYRGDHQEIWLDPLGLRFTTSGGVTLRVGERIEVGLPAENLRVLYA